MYSLYADENPVREDTSGEPVNKLAPRDLVRVLRVVEYIIFQCDCFILHQEIYSERWKRTLLNCATLDSGM